MLDMYFLSPGWIEDGIRIKVAKIMYDSVDVAIWEIMRGNVLSATKMGTQSSHSWAPMEFVFSHKFPI